MYLRPYKKEDAKTILSWCEDETVFRRWTSDRYDHYPITEDDMNFKYFDCNGDCVEDDNFYPMVACDESGVFGHFILRYTNGDHSLMRIGFVIVDDKKRGHQYGKKMMRLAVDYAFLVAGAENVTIGVFENNIPGYKCYKSAGFKEVETEQPETYELYGETWKIIELALNINDYILERR